MGVVESKMPYVVYVNHPNNKAIVHTTTCGKYTKRRRDKTHNGYWSIVEREPFETIEEAMSFARSTGKATVDSCAFCVH